METNERHAYVYAGISWDSFMDWAIRKVKEDCTLTYFIHSHRYVLHTTVPKGCNPGCKIVRTTTDGVTIEAVVESVVASSEGE